jgi:hypothetical protein
MTKYKITAFSVFDKNFAPMREFVEERNKQYFSSKGISYLSFSKDLNKFSSERMSEKNQKYWTKIFILKNLLEQNTDQDWFFLMDSDVVVVDQEFDLNIFPNLVPSYKEFLVCDTDQTYSSKFWNVNTGVFFCKNSEYMLDIISDIISIAIEKDFFVEQPIFQEMLSCNYKNLSSKTAVFPSTSFNHEGKFIYHACNFSTLDMDFKKAIEEKTKFLRELCLKN